MPSTECGTCHQEVHWCIKEPAELNDRGLPKTVPVNADSVGDPEGRVEVWSEPVIPVQNGGPAYVLKFRYMRKGEVPAEGHKTAVSHFATCAQADQWRSRKPPAVRT